MDASSPFFGFELLTYTWRRMGVKYFLEIALREDGETLAWWRMWASLEPDGRS